MSFVTVSCTEFVDVLASKAPVPGGGGASALVGAVGTALGSMVGNLTVGKKKYADVEADIYAIMDKAAALQKELLRLVDEDAVVFEPLSKAYGIPKDDPNREKIMEDALKAACSVPMDIMRACCKAIELHEELAAKGSALALSDVGVGVIFCKSALMGASLNVFINTKSMTDKAYAAQIEKEADGLLAKYCAQADKIYDAVITRLR
ncbi:Formimidoyltetrahydrofolate cyclodeaminase [Sporobacter termitidis DSM 10068]|uniref:Formimidoyltetrahydrofolate cyclodeaminase n=1 Tax=Sporobacter termitidis DSM 10068 TaxID=1123282 RepID=A0A1M5TDG2_9FIRM|nr:cyclodeaminase/cyclohydrolase family protein [Sporobacter termitidis]SHH48758.1 Formimidoyltetrahydrofolate cyclodeaminase [Sporobacter termitidis DSM 10068]